MGLYLLFSSVTWLVCGIFCWTAVCGFLMDNTKQDGCNFETSFCGYTTSPWSHVMHWTRKYVGSDVMTTDHTYNTSGKGYIMYVKPTSANKLGDYVNSTSPHMYFIKGSNETSVYVTVTFWYKITGTNPLALSVNLYTNSDESTSNPFTRTDATGSKWERGCLQYHFNESRDYFYIDFRAETQSSTLSDGAIMVDDILVAKNMPCYGSNPMTTSEPHHVTSVTSHSRPTTSSTHNLTATPGWSMWSMWSMCSTTCDLGTITRNRACVNGSSHCTGNSTEIHECSLGSCPSWSRWYDGSCSSTCGSGTRERLRTCSTGTDSDCHGNSIDVIPCIGTECI